MTAPLKAPFPYPGGKSRIADEVWSRFGNPDNFVEPFAGSLAVLLRRPMEHFAYGYRVETVNDLNHYIVNFWRAVKADPERVAEFADGPVMEADLHARHKWLVRSNEAIVFRDRMRTDPEAFDAKIAGWWVWGACCWIGGAWCQDGFAGRNMQPALSQAGWGVNAGGPTDWEQLPKQSTEDGVHGRPNLADAFDIGRGVHAGSMGTCGARRTWLIDWMQRLADRLRLVRTCYGHWSRVCDSDSTTTRLGSTAVFLDPPYPAVKADGSKSRDADLYATDKTGDLNALRDEVLAWCRKWGPVPNVKIAVCGYDSDGYATLEAEGWAKHAWETAGGYSNQRRGGKGKSANAKRECVWFSPQCVKQTDLFS